MEFTSDLWLVHSHHHLHEEMTRNPIPKLLDTELTRVNAIQFIPEMADWEYLDRDDDAGRVESRAYCINRFIALATLPEDFSAMVSVETYPEERGFRHAKRDWGQIYHRGELLCVFSHRGECPFRRAGDWVSEDKPHGLPAVDWWRDFFLRQIRNRARHFSSRALDLAKEAREFTWRVNEIRYSLDH